MCVSGKRKCLLIEPERQIQTVFSFTWFDKRAFLNCASGEMWFFLVYVDTLFSPLRHVQNVPHCVCDFGMAPSVLFGLDQWFQLKEKKKAVGGLVWHGLYRSPPNWSCLGWGGSAGLGACLVWPPGVPPQASRTLRGLVQWPHVHQGPSPLHTLQLSHSKCPLCHETFLVPRPTQISSFSVALSHLWVHHTLWPVFLNWPRCGDLSSFEADMSMSFFWEVTQNSLGKPNVTERTPGNGDTSFVHRLWKSGLITPGQSTASADLRPPHRSSFSQTFSP